MTRRPDAWALEIDQAWFRGSLFLDEIVFFHRPSRTAILADMSENFSDAFLKRHWAGWMRPIAHVWGIVKGKGYAPLEWRLSVSRSQAVAGGARQGAGLETGRGRHGARRMATLGRPCVPGKGILLDRVRRGAALSVST